jgi:glycosyltransferase involved in cell wall biosynthesis
MDSSNPTVCCVLLVNGRAEMVRRAIKSFKAQTYQNKELLVFDSGVDSAGYLGDYDNVSHHWVDDCWRGRTIGVLRNEANARGESGLIAHWDSDDWSHPRRLEEQVELLQYTGKQCVGYRELLFWDTRVTPGEAWLYRNDDPRWVAGASMMYTREAWEACPFYDAPHEDQRWWMKNSEKCAGVSSMDTIICVTRMPNRYINPDGEPRMICQMHADGTEQIPRKVMESGGGGVWKRAAEWDGYCERTMKL